MIVDLWMQDEPEKDKSKEFVRTIASFCLFNQKSI